MQHIFGKKYVANSQNNNQLTYTNVSSKMNNKNLIRL